MKKETIGFDILLRVGLEARMEKKELSVCGTTLRMETHYSAQGRKSCYERIGPMGGRIVLASDLLRPRAIIPSDPYSYQDRPVIDVWCFCTEDQEAEARDVVAGEFDKLVAGQLKFYQSLAKARGMG